MSRRAQPRVPAGASGGGQFASRECPRMYALLDALAGEAPLPEPTAAEPILEVAPGHYRVYAPRCSHGHFVRWARENCRRCASGR